MENSLKPSLFDWHAPISCLKGVGTKVEEKLTKLQICTMGDLLLHCPFRYEDRTNLTPIQDLRVDEYALVQGEIVQVEEQKGRKKRCILTLSEKGEYLRLVFFHYYPSQIQQWKKEVTLRCFGQVSHNKGLQMIHPEYEIIVDEQHQPLSPNLTPIYPTVAGLSQNWFRRNIGNLLSQIILDVEEKDLADYITTPKMLSMTDALQVIHQPKPDMDRQSLIERRHPAFLRLIVEELLANHFSLKELKQKTKSRQAEPLLLQKKIVQDFLAQLPFKLTQAQAEVWKDIREDLAQKVPMLRLVQGDVGCGKTVVAALASLCAISNGKQVAIMAPTEILSEQHYSQFCAWFSPLGYRVEMLSAKLKAKNKRSCLENITLGIANIVIGTHALFQESVQFKSLGLVIIDEQHRFGVHQRLALQNKGESSIDENIPHQLIMTATPIPRTLAMSRYAHLDISVIDSLPPGRQKITTLVISQSRRSEVMERIQAVCERKQQIYWVCTLIEESEVLECQAVISAAQELQASIPNFRVGIVHGRMESDEKEEIMRAFYQGDISILVATTVIEVGVNVPNATLMVIENPERLGLAQLHQLRGRVGRGSDKSFCILLYSTPLSEVAQKRLSILRESQDGFIIAEADLELRGAGEILGTRQTGVRHFKIADLTRDKEIMKNLFLWEKEVRKKQSSLQIEKIIKRWGVTSQYGEA